MLVLSEYISVAVTENSIWCFSRFRCFNHLLYVLCMYINFLMKVEFSKVRSSSPGLDVDQCSYCFLTVPLYVGEFLGVDRL